MDADRTAVGETRGADKLGAAAGARRRFGPREAEPGGLVQLFSSPGMDA